MKPNIAVSAFLVASLFACVQPAAIDPTSKPVANPPVTPAAQTPEPDPDPSEAKRADLSLTPTKGVDFASVDVGDEAIREITVLNVGDRKATKLDDASTKLGSFAYTGGAYPGDNGDCGSTLAIDDACTLEVVFKPTKAGAASVTLKVSYDDGEEAQTASITLKGLGTTPTVVGPTGNTGTPAGTGPVTRTPSDAAVAKTVDVIGAVPLFADSSGQFSGTAQLTATKLSTDDAITIIAIINTSDQVWITNMQAPNGTVLSDVQADMMSVLNRSYENSGAQAVLIPQTPDIEPQTPAGAYTFSIFAYRMNGSQYVASTAPSVEVYVVHTPKAALTQLDVNLFFSGSAGVTAANAATVTRTKNAIATLKSFYAAAGMTVVNTRFYDLPAAFQHIAYNEEVRNPGYKTMGELFGNAAGKPAGLNFYFIGDIDTDGNGNSYGLLGVAGGIPGPGAFRDTQRSGVMVVLDTTATNASDDMGSTMAHEGGHFLGLFHACERSQDPNAACGSYDNISDTPNSTSAVNNIMYWAAAPTATSWSSLQGKTLRRHPLVH